MRIALPTHLFPPRHRAGVEVYTESLAHGLSKLGHEVAVITTDELDGARVGRIRSESTSFGHVHRIAHDRRAATPLETLDRPEVVAAATEVLRAFRPHVVHFQHLMYLGLPLVRAARGLGAKTLLTLHEYWLLCARGGQFLRPDGVRCERAVADTCARCLPSFAFGRTRKEAEIARAVRWLEAKGGIDLFPWFKSRKAGPREAGLTEEAQPTWLDFLSERGARIRDAFSNLDQALAPSRFLRERFVDAGFPGEKILYWPNGVAESSEKRRERPPPRRPLRVGFLGSIVPQKGLLILVMAHRALPRGSTELRIYGHLNADPAYGRLVRTEAVTEEVTFAGPFSGADRDLVLAEIDVLVVPSLWFENAPMVIAEAALAECPVVASDLGGMRELVEEHRAGLLFAPGDVQDLARTLRRFADEPTLWSTIRAGMKPPKTARSAASELSVHYARLAGATP